MIPSPKIEWNKLNQNIHNSESLNIFKKTLLKLIRPSGNTNFNCHNPKGVRLLTSLRLGLSYLHKHKFKHRFQNSLTQFAAVVKMLKSRLISFFTVLIIQMKESLLNIIGSTGGNILTRSYFKVTETFLYGDNDSNSITNTLIFNATTDFLIATERFDVLLLYTEYGLIVLLTFS